MIFAGSQSITLFSENTEGKLVEPWLAKCRFLLCILHSGSHIKSCNQAYQVKPWMLTSSACMTGSSSFKSASILWQYLFFYKILTIFRAQNICLPSSRFFPPYSNMMHFFNTCFSNFALKSKLLIYLGVYSVFQTLMKLFSSLWSEWIGLFPW